MSIRDSTAIISGSKFALNNASIDGGALNARYSQVSINDCSFNSCNSLRGGAIRTSYGNISIDYVAFNVNSAESRGGGISINEASGNIVNSTFVMNYALSGGGAVHLLRTNIVMYSMATVQSILEEA